MRIKAALLAMGLVSCGLAQAALTSGTYVTEGKGNNGHVVVELPSKMVRSLKSVS